MSTLSEEFVNMGMNVQVLCAGENGHISTKSEAGLTITRIPIPDFPPRNLWFQARCLGLLRKSLSKADIVHGHSCLSTVMTLANHELRRPWVVTVHGLHLRSFQATLSRPLAQRALREDFVYTFGFPYSEMLHRIDLRFADSLVFVAGHMAEDARKLYGPQVARKACMIWAPVSKLALTLSYCKSPTTRRDFTFGYFGRLYWYKGVLQLIDAFSRLTNVNRNVRLRLYGAGPLKRTIEERIARLRLHSNVDFVGWTKSHSGLLSKLSEEVDAFVFPSLYEACPIALLEAMALGKPVVVSDLPWGREFVKDGRTGLLSKPDPNTLAERMETLTGDSALCGFLGKNAQSFVMSNFKPKQVARAYLDLFGTLSR